MSPEHQSGRPPPFLLERLGDQLRTRMTLADESRPLVQEQDRRIGPQDLPEEASLLSLGAMEGAKGIARFGSLGVDSPQPADADPVDLHALAVQEVDSRFLSKPLQIPGGISEAIMIPGHPGHPGEAVAEGSPDRTNLPGHAADQQLGIDEEVSPEQHPDPPRLASWGQPPGQLSGELLGQEAPQGDPSPCLWGNHPLQVRERQQGGDLVGEPLHLRPQEVEPASMAPPSVGDVPVLEGGTGTRLQVADAHGRHQPVECPA